MAEQFLIAELPIGFDGLYGSRNPAQIPPSALTEANNLTFVDGTLRKEGGAVKYNSTAISGSPRIIAGYDWWPDTTTQRMVVVTSAGAILKDSGAGSFSTTLKSGLTMTRDEASFVTAGKETALNNKKLFTFTGQNPVQVLSGDGATTSDIATPPADWSGVNQPVGGLLHANRLWGFGNLNDPHRLYYSTISNHEDFTGALSGTLSVYPGEGDQLVAAVSFRGFIIAFKRPHGIYSIDTTDPVVANWRVDKIDASSGVGSIQSALILERDILFLDKAGNIQSVSQIATGSYGTGNIGQIGFMQAFILDNVALGSISKARAVYYPKDRELHFALPGLGATQNTRRLVVDFNNPERPRFRFSDRDVCVSLWLRLDANGIPKLMSGDDAGFVWKMDEELRSKDAVGYTGKFFSAYTDLSHIDINLATKRKNGYFLEIVAVPTGNWNLSVDVMWDGKKEATYQYNLGSAGSTLGTFVLGTDVLSGTELISFKQKITGGGRRIAIVGSNGGAGQDFRVARFFLHFGVGDERI